MSGKRSDLSVLEKRDILKQYDDLKKCSQRKAASILGISQPLLCKMLKDRHKIEYHEEFNLPITRKRKRAGKCVKVEDGLLRWFVQARTSCVHVTNAILLDKALNIAAQLGIEDFNPTDGWLSRWKSRNNVIFKKNLENKKYADVINKDDNWLDHYLRDVLPCYSVDDVYNMAETGLYYRALPYSNMDGRNVTASECNYQKHRLTVLFVCNMTGSDKRRPLVIGKNQNPRCFHNVKKLPVDYCANSNAWMTSIIFTDFLKQWDEHLKRKILLILNNCTAHPDITLNNITLLFIPMNTSIIQPLDIGIIKTVKTNYRKLMHSYIVNNVGTEKISPFQISCKITILDAVHMLAESWEKVSSTIIQNCFHKAGFASKCFSGSYIDDQEPENLNLQNWVNIDNDIPTSGPFSDSDIIKSYFTQENTKSESNNDENNITDKDVPTAEETRAAIETIKKSLQRFGNDETFKLFYKLKANMENHLEDSYVKNNILNLFE